MSRVQLALNVADLSASIEFYSQLFQTEPHKLLPGYANFEIVDPPLKLVLIEVTPQDRGTGVAGALNHLGVEVFDRSEVTASAQRLQAAGMDTLVEEATNCCYAEQDKVWVRDPAGAPWEVYTITDDEPLEQVRPGAGVLDVTDVSGSPDRPGPGPSAVSAMTGTACCTTAAAPPSHA